MITDFVTPEERKNMLERALIETQQRLADSRRVCGYYRDEIDELRKQIEAYQRAFGSLPRPNGSEE